MLDSQIQAHTYIQTQTHLHILINTYRHLHTLIYNYRHLHTLKPYYIHLHMVTYSYTQPYRQQLTNLLKHSYLHNNTTLQNNKTDKRLLTTFTQTLIHNFKYTLAHLLAILFRRKVLLRKLLQKYTILISNKHTYKHT